MVLLYIAQLTYKAVRYNAIRVYFWASNFGTEFCWGFDVTDERDFAILEVFDFLAEMVFVPCFLHIGFWLDICTISLIERP